MSSQPKPAPRRLRALQAACLLALLLQAAPRAWSKDMGGRLGIGLEQSTTGVSGLALRYWPIDLLNLSFVGGFAVEFLDQKTENVATQFQLLLGLEFRIGGSQHANWTLGVRAGVGYRSESAAKLADPNGSEVLQINIEVPLRLEFYLSDNFSFGVATGFLISIVPFRGAGLDSEPYGGTSRPGTVSFGLGAGTLSGSMGVTYYF